MKKLLTLLLAVVLFTACERKSGRGQIPQSSQNKEKVVILERVGIGTVGPIYSVKVLKDGTKARFQANYPCENNDTILVDPKRIMLP